MKLLNWNGAVDSSADVERATADDVNQAFVRHREELEWLALFLTGDQTLAEACIVDACAIAATENQVFKDWLVRWARRATIRSAYDMQKSRIAELGTTYERNPRVHREQAEVTQKTLQLLVKRSNSNGPRMDVLCRFALVLRGIQHYSSLESALLLNVTRMAIEAAYSTALESLAALSCGIASDMATDAEAFG